MNFIQALQALIVRASGNMDDPSKAVYDVVTALRGPDSPNSEAKKKTTARLRSMLGMTEDSVDRNLALNPKPVKAAEVKEALAALGEHYAGHYRRAAKVVNSLYGVDLLNEVTKSVPSLSEGMIVKVFTAKYPDGRLSIIVKLGGSEYNAVSLHDGSLWFTSSVCSLTLLQRAFSAATWCEDVKTSAGVI